MPECELCGRKTDRLYVVSIEGAILSVCKDCKDRGEVVAEVREGKTKNADGIPADVVTDYYKRIRDARKRKRLKLEDVEKLTGIKKKLLKLFEEGKAVPTIDQAEKLEKVLDIELIETFDTNKRVSNFQLTLGDVVKVKW